MFQNILGEIDSSEEYNSNIEGQKVSDNIENKR